MTCKLKSLSLGLYLDGSGSDAVVYMLLLFGEPISELRWYGVSDSVARVGRGVLDVQRG